MMMISCKQLIGTLTIEYHFDLVLFCQFHYFKLCISTGAPDWDILGINKRIYFFFKSIQGRFSFIVLGANLLRDFICKCFFIKCKSSKYGSKAIKRMI